ncbi:MAG: metallophosphoesterase, partial [Planctomycetota bacterium]
MKLTRRRLLGMAAGSGALALGYAVGIEPVWLRTVEHVVPVRGLDPRLAGFRIAQLSDLHAGSRVPEEYLLRAGQRAMELGADAIVFTGDFVHRGHAKDGVRTIAKLVQALEAPQGVYAVLGNHDYGVYRPRGGASSLQADALGEALESGGVRLLRNESVRVERAGAELTIGGYDDLWSGRFDPEAIAPPTVALSHNPDTAPDLAANGIPLILSGHTHGGQV